LWFMDSNWMWLLKGDIRTKPIWPWAWVIALSNVRAESRFWVSPRLARMTSFFDLELAILTVILNSEGRAWFRIYRPLEQWLRWVGKNRSLLLLDS
jgi:hypothetical protein